MLRRAKNRHTALRLPAILRLRIAATISSSVRSGLFGNLRQQKFRVLLQRRGAAAARLCRNASGLLEPLHPNHHHARAEPIAFGRLTPRGTGLHVFNHSATQVDGIRLRHRSLPKTNQCRVDSLIDKALGIPPIQADRNLLLKSNFCWPQARKLSRWATCHRSTSMTELAQRKATRTGPGRSTYK